MNKYDKMTRDIQSTWKTFGLLMMVLVMIFFACLFIVTWKAKMYKEEFESTTWYETTAVFKRSNSYTERDEDGDDITKYSNFYKYKAKDGNTYEYADINSSSEGYEGQKIQIYVDEKDNSHNLEIRDGSDLRTMKKVIMWVCFPVMALFSIILIIQYMVRAIAKAVMNRC